MTGHIKILNVIPRIQYVGNGAATQFVYPFAIFRAADLEVYLDDVRQETGFTVSGAGEARGGSVAFPSAPASGVRVTLRRRLQIERTTDFQESGVLRAKTLNDELDYQTAALQDLSVDVESAVRLAPTDEPSGLVLPGKAQRAGKVLGFDAGGNVVAKEGAAAGVTDHGALGGLAADDHGQYLTGARADGWLQTKTTDSLAEGSANRYMVLGGPGTAATASRVDHTHVGAYEPAFAKRQAFNRDFGAGATDVARGDHRHALGALADVDDAGKTEGYALVWSAAAQQWMPQPVGGGGAGGGLASAYTALSDGVTTAAAVGAAAVRVRSADGSVQATVGSGDPIYGDNIDLKVAFDGSGAADTAARSDHTHSDYAAASHTHGYLESPTFGTATVDSSLRVGGGTHDVNVRAAVDSTNAVGAVGLRINHETTSGGTAIETFSAAPNIYVLSAFSGGNWVGGITQNGASVIYNTASDYRLKTDVAPLTGAVDRLRELAPCRFHWLRDPEGAKVDGFLAHEAQAVVPEAVTGEKDAVDEDGRPVYQGIDQGKLVPLLVAALQEEIAAREALEARIAALL